MLTEQNDSSGKICSTRKNVAKAIAYSFHAFSFVRRAKLRRDGVVVSAPKSLNQIYIKRRI
jgi:hypothetical protein